MIDSARSSASVDVVYRDDQGEEMATTTAPKTRESHKKLKPKPKTESKSWQTRNAARKDKQAAHAAKQAGETETR